MLSEICFLEKIFYLRTRVMILNAGVIFCLRLSLLVNTRNSLTKWGKQEVEIELGFVYATQISKTVSPGLFHFLFRNCKRNHIHTEQGTLGIVMDSFFHRL